MPLFKFERRAWDSASLLKDEAVSRNYVLWSFLWYRSGCAPRSHMVRVVKYRANMLLGPSYTAFQQAVQACMFGFRSRCAPVCERTCRLLQATPWLRETASLHVEPGTVRSIFLSCRRETNRPGAADTSGKFSLPLQQVRLQRFALSEQGLDFHYTCLKRSPVKDPVACKLRLFVVQAGCFLIPTVSNCGSIMLYRAIVRYVWMKPRMLCYVRLLLSPYGRADRQPVKYPRSKE